MNGVFHIGRLKADGAIGRLSVDDAVGRLSEDGAVGRLSAHRIVLNEGGGGVVRIDEREFVLEGKEVVLMARGQVAVWMGDGPAEGVGAGDAGGGLRGYVIDFDDYFWEKAPSSASNCKSVLFDNTAFNQVIRPGEEDWMGLKSLFVSLLADFEGEDYLNKVDALAAWLKIIMIKIANINAALVEGYDSYDYKQYRSFYSLISEGKLVSHEVEHFAGVLGIPARKLTAVCQRYSGMGAKELISQMLVNEAKRTLQFSAIPVKEIAYQLLFSSPEQFSHFFKKNTGHSPNDYRQVVVKMHR